MDQESHTIATWCALRKISRSMFYKLEARGRAPRTHYVGTRRLISPSADADWLAAREAEAEAASDAAHVAGSAAAA